MIFKLGICDDECMFRQKIRRYCEKFFSLNQYDFELIEYESGEELLNSKEKLDLLFLDIEMGETSGMDVKKYFEESNIDMRIAFLTNHSKMMKQAFGRNIYGFVDKSKFEKELMEIINKVLFEIQNNEIWKVESKEQEVYIRINDIIYIESERIYVNIITKEGVYYKRCSMKECEVLFSERGFCRVHKSYLINFRYFINITEKSVKMMNGSELKISRGDCRKIKEQYVQYVQKRI